MKTYQINFKRRLLRRIKNSEHFDLIESIVDSPKLYVPDNSLIREKWRHFFSCFAAEDKGFMSDRTPEETKQVAAAEKVRANSTRRVKQAIYLACRSPQVDERRLAEGLRKFLGTFRQATYTSYIVSNALITLMMEMLLSDENAEAVKRLHLEPLIEEAIRDNTAFKDIYHERNMTRFMASGNTFAAIRKATDDALEAVVQSLNNLYAVGSLQAAAPEGMEKLRGMMDCINASFSDMDTRYKRRIRMKKEPDGNDGSACLAVRDGQGNDAEQPAEGGPDGLCGMYHEGEGGGVVFIDTIYN